MGLILYERPILSLLPPGFADRLQALLDMGDRNDAWVLTHSRVAVLASRQHVAMEIAPDLFVRTVDDNALLIIVNKPATC
jgi:hypothetical protein